MIREFDVKNFKSVRHLHLNCRRVNLFIGKPNVGKSNILESFAFLSLPYLKGMSQFREVVRFINFVDLFLDSDVSRSVEISAIFGQNRYGVEMGWVADRNHYVGKYLLGNQPRPVMEFTATAGGPDNWTGGTREGPFRYYKFKSLQEFPGKEFQFLTPPDGENLLYLLQTNREFQKLAAELFKEQGFKLVLKPQENKIEIQRELENVIISCPYALISDTLQRFVFHLAAIETNKNAVIVMEEPESHAFPCYTKLLAEQVALDRESGNQFFISTHNPYFLLPLVTKTPKEELAVYVTSMRGYKTEVRLLSAAGLDQVSSLEEDIFFNFDRLLTE